MEQFTTLEEALERVKLLIRLHEYANNRINDYAIFHRFSDINLTTDT